MAVINIDDLSPSYWFDYDDDAAVKIRPLTNEKMIEIRKACVKPAETVKRVGRNKWQRFEYNEVDEEKMQDMVHAWVVANWRGFKTPDGDDFDYSPERAVLLMRKDPKFYAFVDAKLDLLERQFSGNDGGGGPEKN